ncbi:uncharacterized protein STEHIDRAFT_157447 [Stereum hirsutum FP-91666 SS1]|uniref:uncharacterized protein n=1 Tax=Stereum hirsutum (strain FP-91666) TaxID=721885 RepID=UPI000444A5B1|nr:uncharacterized protein STEHIDRAFT_157447 [Stereum hirsutum FP-91666 SS1]EIM85917.1 hypothetical protein STEHIDRAFT_157447 [Stereum hirsutum FP-91666 SS1]
MSTASLPSYSPPSPLPRTPSYTAEPLSDERRLTQGRLPIRRVRPPVADVVKQNKSGTISLRLTQAQRIEGDNPVYGARGPVEGTVELSRTDGVVYVAAKIEGVLKLKEVAAGGTTTLVLCDETAFLWRKGIDDGPCPIHLPFSVVLPATFADEKGSYPLPPTYEAHLSGLPGFQANVQYSVTAVASRSRNTRLNIGAISVSTPFVFHPRSRPSLPIPPPLSRSHVRPGLDITPQWKSHESVITSRVPGSRDILCTLYLPKSQVFCIKETIPFHVSFVSSAMSLASLLPYVPTNTPANTNRYTRIQLLRQTSVDAKNDYVPAGTKTEMWRVASLGEGSFWRTSDGPDWITFSGELKVSPNVQLGGFKAGGLWVKDCIVFSISPPDSLKGPIGDLREVYPIRLVTDPWESGPRAGMIQRESSAGSDESTYEQPYLAYAGH